MKRYKCIALFLIVPAFCTLCSLAEDLTLSVNLRRPVSVVDEKFLSLTLDPITLLYTGNALSTNFEKSTSMARALAPAYVRLGGPVSNFYSAENSQCDLDDDRDKNFVFSESHWVLMQQWTQRTDLDVIACLSPKFIEANRKANYQDAEDTPEIVAFSDHLGYNTSWQLGYECQTRCDSTASDLGRRVLRLRTLLDNVPRYSDSIITGPDIVAYKTKQQQQYLQDYLNIAIPALSAITWHPNFAGVTLDNEGVSLHHDNLAAEKDDLYKVIGPLVARRPLWIAESKAEECKNQFLGALLWTRRLGNVAKLKVDVIMRQPADLSRPTPDYWVSVLHKKLVGREVFDVKIPSANRSHVFLYSQCTKPSANYEKGSVTIFGVNLTPRSLDFHLKGVKITTLHEYILLPGFDAPNRMFAESILLNNEPLNLINDTEVPDIEPVILTNSSGLGISLPSGAIGFWVLPDVKVKSCSEYHETANERMSLRKFEKKITHALIPEDEKEDEEDEDSIVAQSPSRNNFARNGKRKQKGSQNSNRSGAKFTTRDIRRELLKMKKYLKKKLEKDEENQSLSIRGSSRFTYDRQDEDSNEDKLLKSEGEIRSKLTEYKDYLPAKENLGTMENRAGVKADVIHDDILPKALALITQIENSLADADKETTENSDRSDVLEKLEGHMKHLYELLVRANWEESNDFVESTEVAPEQTKKITKRDLERRVTEDPLGLRREAVLKKRSRTDDSVRDRRNERKTKRRDDTRKDVQPKVFDARPTDSGENNFYGFFKREPEKHFPNGDVFLTTGDSSLETDYDYVRDDDQDEAEAKVNHRPRTTVDSDDVWTEDEEDHHSYTPNEFYENIKMPNFSVQENAKVSAELWEAENHQHEESDDDVLDIEVNERAKQDNLKQVSGTHESSKSPKISLGNNWENSPVRPSTVVRQASVLRSDNRQLQHQKRSRTNDERSAKTSVITDGEESFDHSVSRLPKAARLKRESGGLHGVFGQEMINADADNFKDCQCRVIRGPMEPSTLHARFRRGTEEDGPTEDGAQDASEETVTAEDVQSVDAENKEEENEDRSNEATSKTAESGEDPGAIEQSESSTVPPSDLHAQSKREDANENQGEDAADSKNENQSENTTTEEEAADNSQALGEITENPEAPLEGTTEAIEEETTTDSSVEDSSELNRKAGLSDAEESDIELSSDMSEKNQFFRDQRSRSEESNTTADPAENIDRRISDDQEDSAPSTTPSDSQEAAAYSSEVADQTEVSEVQPEIRASEEREATTGNSKRQAESEGTTTSGYVGLMHDENVDQLVGSKVEELNDEAQDKRLVSRMSSKMRSRARSSDRAEEAAKTREAKLTSKLKALIALRKEIADRKNSRVMEVSPRSGYGSYKYQESRRKRAEQIEKLMEKLRERRKLMMRKYQEEVMDIVGEINDEGKRDLKKREVWEKIKDSDDFRDMIDREKLAYILMYKPDDHDFAKRDDRRNEQLVNRRHVPPVEIVRPLNIRERLVSPRNHKNYHDPRIMQYSNPYTLTEKVIQLQELHDTHDVMPRERYNDDSRRNKQTYYALVEDVKNPRIFSYEENPRSTRPSVEVLVPACVNKGGRRYDRPEYERFIDDDRHKEYAEESDETSSDELPVGRKLYVIDPSRYKGGEPILEEHQEFSKSRDRHRKTKQMKPHDDYHRESYDPSRRNGDRFILKVSTNPADHQNDDAIVYAVTRGQNSARDRGQGKLRNNSVTEEAEKNAKVAEQIPEYDEGIGEIGDPSETCATPDVAERTKSSRDTSTQKSTKLEDPADSNVRKNVSRKDKTPSTLNEGSTNVRNRRDTNNQRLNSFLKLSASLPQRKPRESARVKRSGYICVKKDSTESSEESSGESSEERSTKLYTLLKNGGYYRAVPIARMSKLKAPLKKDKKEDKSEEHNSSKNDDDSSEVKVKEIGKTLGSKQEDLDMVWNPYFKPGRARMSDYYNDMESEEEAKDDSDEILNDEEEDVDFGQFYVPRNEYRGSDGMNERASSDGRLEVNKRNVLMLLPLKNRIFGRLRREVEGGNKINDDTSLEKVSSSELRGLDHPSTSTYEELPTSNAIENSDSTMVQNESPEKYLIKKNLSKKYSRKRKIDALKKDLEGDDDKVYGLPSLIEGTIPKLQDVIVGGFEKAKNLTGSVEQLIENFDEKFNDTLHNEKQKIATDSDSRGTANQAFHSAIINIKKFFTLLGGITRILRG